MPHTSLILPRIPSVPFPLAIPLGLVPSRIHSAALVLVLNQVFARPLREGELDFLEGRLLEIGILDARVTYRLTLHAGRLEAAGDKGPADTQIEGSAFDFLCLATRQEDADTLFFNRRLRFGGDTELGLNLKNFLDSFDPPGELSWVLDGVGGMIRRFSV